MWIGKLVSDDILNPFKVKTKKTPISTAVDTCRYIQRIPSNSNSIAFFENITLVTEHCKQVDIVICVNYLRIRNIHI